MSESTSAPIEGADTASESDTGYEAIVDQLDKEGFVPSADQNDPDQQTDGEEEPEGERIKLKVNGKTIEKSYADVIKMAQLYEATNVKLETAKKEIESARATKAQFESQQNAVRQLLGVMQRGDIDSITEFVHEKLGAGDVWDQAIVKAALRMYEISKMSPEQRQALENEKLIKKYRAEAEERRKQDESRAFDLQVNQWSEYINVEIPKAIQTIGLPDTAFVREHIISTWRAAIERGQTPTATAVANFVKKRLDEAKMLGQPAPKPPAVTRPRATRESVAGRNRLNGSSGQYQSWSEWQKTRGN
jgi:hypothetical protein